MLSVCPSVILVIISISLKNSLYLELSSYFQKTNFVDANAIENKIAI